ncbi:MAG: Rv3654c family TadE-like protein [Actinomycetota bacterium]
MTAGPAARRSAGARERGAGSVLVLAAVLVIVTALLAVATLGSGYRARHRAAAAADLSALAAAETLRSGDDPCAAAEKVSMANGASLRSCAVEGWEVEVAAATAIRGPLRWLPDPVRRARAGLDRPPVVAEAVVGEWLEPVAGDYRITATFGEAGSMWASGRHTGLDFAAPTGTPVVAIAPGRVVAAGPSGGAYGRRVIIDHGAVTSYYAHLSAVAAEPGDRVGTGQRIGAVGSSGNTTGPHLHLEVRVDGVPRDPYSVLRSPA